VVTLLLGVCAALTIVNLNVWFAFWAWTRVNAERQWSRRAREISPAEMLEMAASGLAEPSPSEVIDIMDAASGLR